MLRLFIFISSFCFIYTAFTAVEHVINDPSSTVIPTPPPVPSSPPPSPLTPSFLDLDVLTRLQDIVHRKLSGQFAEILAWALLAVLVLAAILLLIKLLMFLIRWAFK